MPAVIMTKVTPMAIMPITDVCRAIVMIFSVLKKKGELKLKNSTNIIKLKRGARRIKSSLFIFIFLLLLSGEVTEIVII
ncbi:hypothetical protein AWE76_20545 [Escherichia coli]|nr:hypothetical protein AWE76_20545 [Escherichia coli]